MPQPFSTLFATLALLAGTVAPTTARAQEDIQGGADGNYFEYNCGAGRVLVGLHGNAGVWVDSVQAVCARVDEAGALSDVQPQGPSYGGSGGSDQGSTCPPGRAVMAAVPNQNEDQAVIGRIDLRCLEFAHPAGGGKNEIRYGGTGHLRSYRSPDIGGARSQDIDLTTEWRSCPNGQFAVGIKGRSSNSLNAFALICGGVAPAKIDAAFANLLNQEASFQTSNFNDRFIRHRNSLGYAEAVSGDLGRDDSTFRIDPGLAGKCISLESHNYPGQYLRHQAWRVKLAPNDNSDLFKQDATFCMVPGLASSTGVSFESVNNPHHFIRHRNGELWVDDFDGSALFRADATFNVTNPGGALNVR